MKARSSVILGFCLLSGLLYCNPFDLNENVLLPVHNLEAPATAAPNTAFTVTLTVEIGGCVSFNRIDVQRFAQGVRLIPLGTNASVRHPDAVCPSIIKEEAHDVLLDPPFANPFQIYVEQGPGAPPVTTTVQIQ